MLEQWTISPLFSLSACVQKTSNQTRGGTRRQDCATPCEIHNHLSTTQPENLLAVQKHSLALQCMSSPTVGQIRTANHWVHRARQFADVRFSCLSILPKVTHHQMTLGFSVKDSSIGDLHNSLFDVFFCFSGFCFRFRRSHFASKLQLWLFWTLTIFQITTHLVE